MAVVHILTPRDGGTYQTQSDGALVPFVCTGVCDAPGLAVSLYDDATNALLGNTLADATPNPSGTWAGWYPWSVPVYAWTQIAGAVTPGAVATSSAGGVSLAASLPVPSAAATSEAGGVAATQTTLLNAYAATAFAAAAGMPISVVGSLAAASATSEAGAASPSGSLSAPNASATSSAGDATISGGGGGSAPTYVGAGTFYNGSVAGGTVAVDVPTASDGDLFLLFAKNAVSTPTGWTLIQEEVSSDTRLFYKFRSGAISSVDITTYDDGEGGTYATYARVFAFRGVNATPVDVKSPSSGFTNSANSSTHTGAALSPASGSMVVLFDTAPGAKSATGAGGAADSYVAASSANGSLNVAYDSTAGGKTTAPTLTFGSAFTSFLLTIALKAA